MRQNIEEGKEVSKKRYIPPQKGQKIIGDLRLV